MNSLCQVDNRYDTLPPRNSPQSLANNFDTFFIKKIELIQEDIDKVDSYLLHSKLERFSRLREDSVQRIIMSSSSNAASTLDPIPTWLIKRCSDALTPTITQLQKLSLLEGHIPAPWKNAMVKPQLKKSGIDPILKN